MKVEIDGKEHEIEASQLKLDDGYALITPDSIPDGYYNENGVKERVKERIKNTAENAVNDALEDPKFQRKVLSKYNISLDKDNKPIGLDPAVDIDEVRAEERKRVAEEKDAEIEQYKQKLTNRDKSVIENSILSSTSNDFQDYWLENIDSDKPLIVEKYMSKFGVDDDGKPYLKNENGEKAFKNDGSPIRPKDYFSNEELFGKYYKDKRQRGSNFNGQGKVNVSAPKGDPTKWKRDQKLEYIAEHGRDGYKDLIRNRSKQETE